MPKQAKVKQIPNIKVETNIEVKPKAEVEIETQAKPKTKKRTKHKIVKKIEKEDIPEQKLNRGFKKCQQCQNQMHIHKKECNICHHIQQFSNKSKKENKNQDIVNDVIAQVQAQPRALSKLKKDKTFVLNKSLLKEAIYNKDHILIDNIQQQGIYTDGVKGNALTFVNDRKFILDGQEKNSLTINKVGNADIIYFGAPILGLAVKNNTIAVAIQLNQYEGQQFSQLHQPNKKYDGQGLILIIQNQTITQIAHQHGSSLQLKFSPLQELLGSINADGSFSIITNQVKAVQDGLFSCFDWCYSTECILALGSQDGNLSIYKFNQQFILINYIDNYHFGIIKDIQFYYHNDSQMSLLASGGYDGNLKIINPMQGTAIFDENICTKGILSVKWDIGGKYIVVLKDELHHRAQLVSFFSVLRDNNQKHTLQDTEQRFIHQLAGDDFTISIGASFQSQNLYFGSNFGVVYNTSYEQIRKQAIKKEKKMICKSDEFHKGQISINEGKIKYDSNFVVDKQQSKSNLSDWTKSYQYIDVSNKLVVMANILGILVIKQINQ